VVLGLQNGPTANTNSVSEEAQVAASYDADRVRQQVKTGNNYNTAARGWGKQQDYYRPVTFNNKPLFT